MEVWLGGGWWSVTVFSVLIVSPNRVAACSNCLHISLVSSSVWAMIGVMYYLVDRIDTEAGP